MDASEKKIWGIHTKDESLFLNGNVIAIGWAELGDLSKIAPDRESFRERMSEAFPSSPKQSIANMTGQVFRFVCEVKVGDYVVFPSRNDRMINIGIVEGEYFYAPEAKEMPGEYVNRKKVKWIKKVPRTMFTQGALYEAGSAMSLFTIKNYAEEYLAALDSDFKKTISSDDTEDESVGLLLMTLLKTQEISFLKS